MASRRPPEPAPTKDEVIGQPRRQVRTLVLLALGALTWLWVEHRAAVLHGHGLGPVRWLLIAAAAALSFVPAVRALVLAVYERIRRPSPRAVEWASVGIALGATCYFVFTAFYQDRDLFPKTHDEGSYVIGLRMLARGRLWMPQHPLADFFDTFYVIVRPVYASLYFPGTALLYAPSDWFQWPTWVLPVVAAGAVVGLLYRVVTELVDGAAAALAAMVFVSLSWYRMLSVLVFSQVPLLLMALLFLWAWLRWRRGGGLTWALTMGVFAGWAAIVRPLDAMCYSVPVGAAVLYDLRGRRAGSNVLTCVVVLAGALPFVALQLYFNKGVTGRFMQTPYTFYLRRDQPGTSIGFHAYDLAVVPESTLPQKREYYHTFMAEALREHQPGTVLQTWARKSLPRLFDTTLPARFLIVLVPVGLLGLTDVRRAALWATLPLFVAGYVINPFFLEHYAAAVIPAVLLSVILGLRVLSDAWPRWRDYVLTSGVLVLIVLSVTSLYELNPVVTALDSQDRKHLHEIDDETFHSNTLRLLWHAEDLNLVQAPAVILFKYSPGVNIIEEPVYNTSVAWPNDAAVIRAHDLGERNREIFDYYAKRQPDRTFYRFDRATGTLTRMGKAADLAARP